MRYYRNTMATYLYETIPGAQNQPPRRFEFKQSMKDAPFASHPETGEPIRRVIVGGFGLMSSGASATPSRAPSSGGSCGCGAGGCCS